VASTALLQRMERLRQEIALMKDELLTDGERVGLDFIRNDEDLELAIKFQLEVYYEGKTEAVWAAEHPREYERLQRIAGTVPAMKTSGT
jgi:hypothetical protein